MKSKTLSDSGVFQPQNLEVFSKPFSVTIESRKFVIKKLGCHLPWIIPILKFKKVNISSISTLESSEIKLDQFLPSLRVCKEELGGGTKRLVLKHIKLESFN